ncbi:EF-hand domain-containing protein [Pseudoscourfieldia marina]
MAEQPALGDARAMLHHVRLADLPEPLRSQLAVFDTNGDGTINPNELPTGASDYISIKAFPADLQKLLNEIDDEKNGKLELDELLKIFTLYAEMKRANKEGSISIKTLPKELQPTLKVFDVDGDGTVAPMELARGAELYKGSKKTAKRLMTFSGVLLLILCALVGVIVGLVAMVVEESKETKTDSNNYLVKKGTNTPVGTAEATESIPLFDMPGQTADVLSQVKHIDLEQFGTLLGYAITGYHATGTAVTFLSPLGDRVTVDGTFINVTSAAGIPIYSEKKSANRRRGLLGNVDGSFATVSRVTQGTSKNSNSAQAKQTSQRQVGVCFNMFYRFEETKNDGLEELPEWLGGLSHHNPKDMDDAAVECLDMCKSIMGCVGFTMAGDGSVCHFKSEYVTSGKEYKFAGDGSWTDVYLESHKDKNGYDACMRKVPSLQTMRARLCTAEKEKEKEAAVAKCTADIKAVDAKAKEDKDKLCGLTLRCEGRTANHQPATTPRKALSNIELKFRISIWMLDPELAIKAYGPMGEWDTSQVTDMSGLFNAKKRNNLLSYTLLEEPAPHRSPDGTPGGVTWLKFYVDDKVRERNKNPHRAPKNKEERDLMMYYNCEALHQSPVQAGQLIKDEYCVNLMSSTWNRWFQSEYHRMFYIPDISKWDVSKVTDMSEMFMQANGFELAKITDEFKTLSEWSLSPWNTSKVTNMWRMFYNTGGFATHHDDHNPNVVKDIHKKWDMDQVTNKTDWFFDMVDFNNQMLMGYGPYIDRGYGTPVNDDDTKDLVDKPGPKYGPGCEGCPGPKCACDTPEDPCKAWLDAGHTNGWSACETPKVVGR